MKFLVGVDGSPASAAALRWTAALAKRIDAELVVVHVYSADAADPSSWTEAHEKRRYQLEGWCEPAWAAGANVQPVLLDGELGPAIIAAAEKYEVDLIVV